MALELLMYKFNPALNSANFFILYDENGFIAQPKTEIVFGNYGEVTILVTLLKKTPTYYHYSVTIKDIPTIDKSEDVVFYHSRGIISGIFVDGVENGGLRCVNTNSINIYPQDYSHIINRNKIKFPLNIGQLSRSTGEKPEAC